MKRFDIYNKVSIVGDCKSPPAWSSAILALLLMLLPAGLQAKTYVCRYVNAETGNYANDGLTWVTAKNNLQGAIDELYEEIKNKGTDVVGYVFVAGTDDNKGMVYVPTRRSTDDADGSLFNTSFRIYERIYVYGGFKGDETADDISSLPGKRVMTNGLTLAEDEALIDRDNIDNSVRRWNFKYKTVLSGNHSIVETTFTYDTSRGRYATTFPLNSYHVVWFATNGTLESSSLPNHFKPLENEACLDGCTIKDGYAASRNISTTSERDHTGFGGGVYMVKNALLRNCVVEYCAATLRGGGVYMDGGGEMDRCYVHTCQASGIGVIAGCYITDGIVERNCMVRISRGKDNIYDGPLVSLKRFKDDVREAREGYECGMVFEKFNDLAEGDIIEAYKMVRVEQD